MACCAMSNVLVSTTRLPNDPLTRLPFGGLVIAPSAFDIAQQAILQLTFVAGPYPSPLNLAPTSHFHLSSLLRFLYSKVLIMFLISFFSFLFFSFSFIEVVC